MEIWLGTDACRGIPWLQACGINIEELYPLFQYIRINFDASPNYPLSH